MRHDMAKRRSLVRIVDLRFAALYGQIQASAVGHSPFARSSRLDACRMAVAAEDEV